MWKIDTDRLKSWSAIFLLLSTASVNIFAQTDTMFSKSVDFENSISTDPLFPLFNSLAILYEYKHTEKSSFIAGLWYGKATETYPNIREFYIL